MIIADRSRPKYSPSNLNGFMPLTTKENIMLKRLTRKLFTLSVLVAYLTLAVPSTPAQGSGYSLSGNVWYQGYDANINPGPVAGSVSIYKWNGSSWALHGYAYTNLCGQFYYDTGGPGLFRGEVNGTAAVRSSPCGYDTYYAYVYMYGLSGATVSAEHPSAGMYISTWSEPN